MTDAALAWALAAAGLLYAIGLARSGTTTRWPRHRTAAWYAGLAAATAGLLLDGDFGTHAAGHLLLGMVAPLLLVLAAPVTLALRALPADRARRLSRLLRSRPLRLLTSPAVAAVLDVGGLWLLYTTDLYALAARQPAVHLVVQAHVLLAGYLFTAALVGVDPAPHRPRPAVRAAVLVLAAAAHAVLAKHLYGAPPAGVPDARAGALLMYYGGDAVEVALAVLLCREWLASAARRGVAQSTARLASAKTAPITTRNHTSRTAAKAARVAAAAVSTTKASRSPRGIGPETALTAVMLPSRPALTAAGPARPAPSPATAR